MGAIIDAAVGRSRAVLLILLMIFIVGYSSYSNIPKEQAPDVKIPIIYVTVTQEGISPEDAERMILRPLETELKSIEGIKEMRANASLGRGAVVLEFVAGFNSDKALQDVREKVDLVKPDLPEEAEEPTVTEVNFSLFPVLNVILTGKVPERTLLKLARDLRDRVESIPEVLSVDVAGDREEQMDIVIDPLLFESYGLSRDILELVSSNNKLITAGTMDNETGGYNVKVPGLLEDLNDILELPIKFSGTSVTKVKDVAEVQKTFKDPTGFARVNGNKAIALEVSKRTGENLIETVSKVKALVAEESKFWPEGIKIVFSQDQSGEIIDMLNDLQNSILLALILVLVVVISVVGTRSATLVAISIPGAFLFGVISLYMLGLTMNIVVLFSLILSVGLLVDSAVVVTEYADRKLMEGESYKKAYIVAAKRMSWPIIASTITTLAVFMPLLFWPGVVGQFMRYMPMTLIAVLTGSLLMALIFVPTLGIFFAKRFKDSKHSVDENVVQAETGDVKNLGGFTGKYVGALVTVVNNAGFFSVGLVFILLTVYGVYFAANHGSEFFPKIEPTNVQVQVRARGNLSVYEKDEIVKKVESRILDMSDEVKVFYARSGFFDGSRELAEDVIGVIQMELKDWDQRRTAEEIFADIRNRVSDISGVIIETREEEQGPPVGRPIQLEIGSRFPEKIPGVVETLLKIFDEVGGFVDLQDSRPAPGIEWEVELNREKAIQSGLTAQAVGDFVRLITRGLKITTYRPDDADDEVDVMLRYPKENRNLETLKELRIVTPSGAVPISNFVEVLPKPRISTIERVDGKRVLKIESDVDPGVLPDRKVKEITEKLASANVDPTVEIKFKGEDEEQKEAGNFLAGAFGFALFAMSLILVIQFNSVYQMLIIMSAVFLSTVGVLLGLLVTAQPFGVVMCGVGIISLAGIVVNNNIIFIDTYKVLREGGMGPEEALLRTGAQRLRPILLTAGTTVLGLIPMVMAMQIDFIDRTVAFGAPSTQWWKQLSTTICGGLAFATVLTLFLTPALLMLGERFFSKNKEKTVNQVG